MKNQRQLTGKQQKFLLTCRDEPETMDVAMTKLNIRAARLSRWLRRPFFREALRAVMQESGRQGRLELKMLVRKALKIFSRALAGDPTITEMQLLAAQTVLELDRNIRFRPIKRGRGRRPAPFDPKTLVHESVPKEEAERLLKVILGNQPVTGVIVDQPNSGSGSV